MLSFQRFGRLRCLRCSQVIQLHRWLGVFYHSSRAPKMSGSRVLVLFSLTKRASSNSLISWATPSLFVCKNGMERCHFALTWPCLERSPLHSQLQSFKSLQTHIRNAIEFCHRPFSISQQDSTTSVSFSTDPWLVTRPALLPLCKGANHSKQDSSWGGELGRGKGNIIGRKNKNHVQISM